MPEKDPEQASDPNRQQSFLEKSFTAAIVLIIQALLHIGMNSSNHQKKENQQDLPLYF